MAVAGTIAAAAREELPATWDRLANEASFGDAALTRRVNAVMVSLFGTELNEAEQDALDNMVVDYAGKLVALKIVGPGIDYWGKQPTQVSATGRNENKTWASRAADLKDLRKQLLEDTRGMWPDVEPLLPSRRNTIGTPIPTTRNLSQAGHVTPNPDDFESPYGLPTTGVNQGIGGVGGT